LSQNGYDVLFLSTPITPFHRFSKNKDSYETRKRIHAAGGVKVDSITSYIPGAILMPRGLPLLSSKWLLWNWDKFTYPVLKRKIHEFGFSNIDLLWMGSLVFAPLLTEIDHKKVICRIADDRRGFSGVDEKIFSNEMDVIRKIDHAFFSSKDTMEKYKDLLDGISYSYMENGIDIDNFIRDFYPLPIEYKKIPSPRIIYVGSIEYWFDEEVMLESANKLPETNFIIIGPKNVGLPELSKKKNVHFLGSKPFQDIANYLYHSDVGIIPFNTSRFKKLTDGIDPLKLYEYLACGLPVVSTKWKTLEMLQSPAILSRDKRDFVNNIRFALSLGKKEEYIEFARMKSWQNIYKQIEQIIEA
jgi:glycosyltransferase involved in cell wall biosynthesis